MSDDAAGDGLEKLSNEQLIRLLRRALNTREQLSHQIGAVFAENVDLRGVIQEQSAEIGQLKAPPDVEPHPEVLGDVTS